MILGKARAPSGTRLYAIGDVHGCITQLDALFQEIYKDLQSRPVADHKIITLGDYVDRGPDSRAVLQFLIEKRNAVPLICLRGNHDQRMLEFLDIPEEVGEAFLHYGGRELLQSYGVDPDRTGDITAIAQMFRQQVPRDHIAFLDSLPLSNEEQDYFVCHAGIRPGVDLKDQVARDLLWIRNAFLVHQQPHPKVIVHGHTPRDSVDIQSNRINLDTECYYSGVLSCVVLEGNGYRLIQTRP